MDNNEFKLRFGNNAVIDKEKYLEYSQIVEQEIFNNINDAKNKAIQIKLEDMNNFVSIFVKSGSNSPKYIIVSLKNREIAHNLFYEEAIDTSTLNILAEHYKTIKQDYNKWNDDVLARINSEEYQNIEEENKEEKENMNNEIKETNLTLRVRNYNGDYGVGSVFVEEFKLNVKQLANNLNKQDGLVIFTANTGFCCNLNLGANQLANIKTEIPFLVKYDKLNTFNGMVEKIKSDSNYKYSESHYANDKFDPKRLEYFDIIIDEEEFESNDDSVFNTLLHDVINVEEITALMDDYYQKLTPIMKKMNKVEYDDPSILNVPYEERIVLKLVDKIKELSPNVETTIAQLLQLTNEDVAKIEPLLQGKVFNNLEKACAEANLKIEVNHDEIGGLGYHYKFKKVN